MMKKSITIILIILSSSISFSCSTMKGAYVSITPLANTGFDPDHFETLGFAYTPGTDDGKILKKELADVFIEEQFKITGESKELEAIQKSGLLFTGKVSAADAQKLGKITRAKAVIIINKTDFAGNGKVNYISLIIVDTYGGVLLRAEYKGGESPDDIDRAARSVVYRIKSENMKLKEKSYRDKKELIFPINK